MRQGFSLLIAISVIVIVSILSMLVLNLGGKVVKATTLQYRQEQAVLLAKSYTELAIMSVLNYDRNATNECVETVQGVVNNLVPGSTVTGGVSSTNGGGYRVSAQIYYLGNNLPCSATRILNTTPIVTDYADGNNSRNGDVAAIIVDVKVQYKDPDADDPANSPWITYRHRTLQKI